MPCKFLFVSLRRPDRRHRLAGDARKATRRSYCIERRGGARDRRRASCRKTTTGARRWTGPTSSSSTTCSDRARWRRSCASRASGSSAARRTPTARGRPRDSARTSSRRRASPIIPQQNFTSFDDAIAFVRANPNRYVIKPSGEAQNYKRLLFVGEEEDGRDVVEVLEDYKRAWSNKIKEFQLQRRIVGRRGRDRRVLQRRASSSTPICVNFEHKKLFPGRHRAVRPARWARRCSGASPTRSSTPTLQARWSRRSRAEGYVGYIDVNCIVNANGIYPLEFTARFGYPTISIQQEGLAHADGRAARRARGGHAHRACVRAAGFQVGVRVVVPPFPYQGPRDASRRSSKDAVILFKTEVREGFHIEDVKLVNGEWLVTGHLRRRADRLRHGPDACGRRSARPTTACRT